MRKTLGALLILLAVTTGSATAGTVFSDDFEGGDLSKWVGKGGGGHSGVIVVDPANPGGSNDVLSFTTKASGGDVFQSIAVSVAVGDSLTLSFDYFGYTGGGGFIGYAQTTTVPHTWLAGTAAISGADPALIDDGTWRSFSYTFDSKYDMVRVMVEDFISPANNAFFDNIDLSTPGGTTEVVPLPSAALLGFGLLALAGAARRIRRRR